MEKGFSIIIPAHNEDSELEATLRSIKWQDSRGSVEVIVVNNNSVDRTAEIAKILGARVVTYAQTQCASDARNFGADKAQEGYCSTFGC